LPADTEIILIPSGRGAPLMAKPLVRLRVVEVGLAAALLALVVRRAGTAGEGRRYAAAAKAQRTEHVVLDARRAPSTTGMGRACAHAGDVSPRHRTQ